MFMITSVGMLYCFPPQFNSSNWITEENISNHQNIYTIGQKRLLLPNVSARRWMLFSKYFGNLYLILQKDFLELPNFI